MKKKENNIICHHNTWWWGESFNIAINNGIGLVEVQFEKAMPNVAYITGLSVKEDCRQQGIGGAIIKSCEELALKSGKSFLQLTVEKDNIWLQEWYKRIGFVVFNEEEHIYVMLKALAVRDVTSFGNEYYSKEFSTTHNLGEGGCL